MKISNFVAKAKCFFGLASEESPECSLRREQLELFGLYRSKTTTSILSEFSQFLSDLFSVIISKIIGLGLLPFRALKFSFRASSAIKRFVVSKLVWGRGKLSTSATRLGVFAFSVAVFVLGGTGWIRTKGSSVPFSAEGDILAQARASAPVSYSNTSSGEPLEYKVKPGDTLSSIGEKFKVSISSIRYANNIQNVNRIKPGDTLTIPPVSGVLHTVEKGDTVKSLADRYKVSPQSVVDFNYLFYPFDLQVGEVLVIPGGEIPSPKPQPRQYASPDAGRSSGRMQGESVASLGTGQFMWPTNRRSVSQYFSRWHPAIDIPKFSPVFAIDSGTVVEVHYGGWNYGYGKMVELDHGNGYRSLYAHFSSVNVKLGQKISRGQILGNMGNTGRSFGTHLHLEIMYQGRHINPLSVL